MLPKQTIYLSIFFYIFSTAHCFSQENPYKDFPVNLAESNVIKEFKRFEFLESVLSAEDGSIYTTSHFDGKLYKIKDDKVSTLMDIEGELLCLAFGNNGNILVTGWNDKHEQLVFEVNENGESKIIAHIADAEFLNGITRLNNSTYLIADSYKGAIWKLDLRDNSTSLWLEHDLFKRPTPDEKYPGINGIKVHNNTVYVSNTTKFLIVKIPILENNDAGKPELFAQGLLVDDFTIDHTGNIYAATHIFNSVVKITPKGKVSIIAQSDQGVAGSTSVAWKHGSNNILLVSTNGGMNSPNKSDVVTAKIVQLQLK